MRDSSRNDVISFVFIKPEKVKLIEYNKVITIHRKISFFISTPLPDVCMYGASIIYALSSLMLCPGEGFIIILM